MLSSIIFLAGAYLPQLSAHNYITEPFALFFLLISVFFFLKKGLLKNILSGLFLGIGILFKPTIALIYGAFFLHYLLNLRYKSNRTKKYVIHSSKNLISIFSGIMIPLLITYAYFTSINAGKEMMYYSFFFVSEYSLPFRPELYFTGVLVFLPIWIITVCTILFYTSKFLHGKPLNNYIIFLLSFFIIFIALALIIAPDHRTLFAIPSAAVLSSIFLYDAYKEYKKSKKLIQSFIIIVLILTSGLAIGTNIYAYNLYEEEGLNLEEQKLSAKQVEHIVEGPIYMLPVRHVVYLFSDLEPGITYLGGLFSKNVTDEIIKELYDNNVSYIVVSKNIADTFEKNETPKFDPEARKIIYDYVISNYYLYETTDYFYIYKHNIG